MATPRTQAALLALFPDPNAQMVVPDAAIRDVILNVKDVVATIFSSADARSLTISDAGTTTTPVVQTYGHESSGTPAAGFGSKIAFVAKDSTTSAQAQANITAAWTTATHASRASNLTLSAFSVTSEQVGINIIGDSGGVQIGFFGVTPVARQAAQAAALTATLTLADTTGSPTYSLSAMTSTTPWGFASQQNAKDAMFCLKDVVARLATLETKVKNLGLTS